MNERKSHIRDEEINRFLDGELKPKERDAIQKHLANCEVCAARVQQYKLMFAELHSLHPIPVQRDYSELVIGTIEASHSFEEPQSVFKTWIPSLVFVVQIVVTFGLILFFTLELSASFRVANLFQSYTFLQESTSVVFIQWGEIIDSLSSLILQFSNNIRGSLHFQLPWGLVGICLSIGIIIWIVLNGVLLGYEAFDERQKQNY